MSALEELASRALAREASRPIIDFGGRWFTWGEMRRVAERMSSTIDASGSPPGAPVALVSRNRPSSVAALLGLIAAGRTVRMVHPFQSSVAMARDVERLKATAVIAASEDFTEEGRSELASHGIAGIALSEMEVASVSGLEACHIQDIEVPDEPRIEILTRGPTGPTKHFAVSFETIVRHHVGVQFLASGQNSDPLLMPPMLLFFPLGNITGIYSTIPTLLRGRRVELWDRFTVEAWHKHVLRYRPEIAGVPPAGLQMILDANIPAEDLASIRAMNTGAAPLDPTVQRAFEERYGIPILLAYGATEFAGPVASMTAELYAEWGRRKLGSAGRPLPGAQLRVVDPETGAVLPPGTEGVLEVITPRIGSNWIRTSDIVVIDEDGFLFHRGRRGAE